MKHLTKVEQISEIVSSGMQEPASAFRKLIKLASSSDWKEREVAATGLVRISEKQPKEVLTELQKWSKNSDENVRRAASEGLRGLARTVPKSVMPIVARLKADDSIYVRKSVANILRNATKVDQELVFKTCKEWAQIENKNVLWTVKDGMKKLAQPQRDSISKLVETRMAGLSKKKG